MKKVLKRSREVEKEDLEASALKMLGYFFQWENDWNNALEYCEESLGIATKRDNIGEIAQACIDLGSIYLHLSAKGRNQRNENGKVVRINRNITLSKRICIFYF